MYKANRFGHTYSVGCRCVDCINYELNLKDMIQREQNYQPHWAEWSRPITEKTFK